MIWLSDTIEFPSYESTSNNGIIALGGDLSEERLMYAYQNGIFPGIRRRSYYLVLSFPKNGLIS